LPSRKPWVLRVPITTSEKDPYDVSAAEHVGAFCKVLAFAIDDGTFLIVTVMILPNDRGSPEKTRAGADRPSTTVPAAFAGASAC
jgi:hypothetical protein